MCDICMHSPCLSGCPNAPDPTPVTHCCSCGEPIIPGDEYGIIDGVLMLCLGFTKVQADDSGLITEQIKINVEIGRAHV